MALGGAGLPLPDCIEDSFLSWLTRLVMLGWLPDMETTVTAEQESCEQVMRSFNRAYPLKVDLDASSTAKEGSECDEEEVRGEEEEVVKDATLDLASAKA